MKRSKKVLKIVANILVWIFVVFAAGMTVLSLIAQGDDSGYPSIGGKYLMPVMSPSMEPTFKKGDMILVDKLESNEVFELKVGDVITFKTDLNEDGVEELNTHRIEKIEEKDGFYIFTTKGDHNPVEDTSTVRSSEVIGQYNGKRVPGMGTFMNFIGSPKGFLVCIVLPLVLLVIYYVYSLISTYISIKKGNTKTISKAEEELIKQKAVEEYLKQQEKEKATLNEAKTEEVKTEEAGEEPSEVKEEEKENQAISSDEEATKEETEEKE